MPSLLYGSLSASHLVEEGYEPVLKDYPVCLNREIE
jgi:hypothetical protein